MVPIIKFRVNMVCWQYQKLSSNVALHKFSNNATSLAESLYRHTTFNIITQIIRTYYPICYHISIYQISLHISDAIRGCMIPCELHHFPCLWLSYQCKLFSHYCRMRDEGSTKHLPPQLNDIRSHNRSSVVISSFQNRSNEKWE